MANIIYTFFTMIVKREYTETIKKRKERDDNGWYAI